MWVPPRDKSLHSTMGERAGQLVARHLPRRCFEHEPSAVYKARLGGDAGLRNFRTLGLNSRECGLLP